MARKPAPMPNKFQAPTAKKPVSKPVPLGGVKQSSVPAKAVKRPVGKGESANVYVPPGAASAMGVAGKKTGPKTATQKKNTPIKPSSGKRPHQVS